MPRTPRKNPSPRKLLQLSPGEQQQKENSDAKELTEFSVKDTAAVDEDFEVDCAAINSSHSECVICDTAVCDVSSVQGSAIAGNHRQFREEISVAVPVGHVKSTDIKTYTNRQKGSKYSERQRKKVATRSIKAAKCLPTDDFSDVDEKVDLNAASVNDECAAGRNVHSIGELDASHQSMDSCEANDSPADNCNAINAVMMLSSAACSSSDAIRTPKDQRKVVAGQPTSPEETEGGCIPTPQKNQLRCLSQELFSLNQESAHITTHIHCRAGTTPRRDQTHAIGGRRSLSTPRKFSILSSNSRSNSRSPRSTPRKITGSRKTPIKVKFPFATTPSKSEKEVNKTPASKKKSPCSSSVLNFPTPSKKQTKRKLYVESPEYGARKTAKVARFVLIVCNFRTKHCIIALLQNNTTFYRLEQLDCQLKLITCHLSCCTDLACSLVAIIV